MLGKIILTLIVGVAICMVAIGAFGMVIGGLIGVFMSF